MLFLPWVFTFVSSPHVAELTVRMLLSVPCEHWYPSPAPVGAVLYTRDLERFDRLSKEGKKPQHFAVISAQTWGKGVDEVRRLQIVQYYTFPHLLHFLTTPQLTPAPESCRSWIQNEKKNLSFHLPFLAVAPLYIGPSVMGQEYFPLLVKNGSVSCVKSHPTGVCKRILPMTVASRLLTTEPEQKPTPSKHSSSAVPKSLLSPPDQTSCWSK